jgi:predicted ester cyclase
MYGAQHYGCERRAAMQDNKALYREFVEEVINRKNYAVIDRLVDPNVVSHDPFPGQQPGAAGVVSTFKLFHKAFPDLHAETREVLAEGDKVAGLFTVTGTHKGEFLGNKPTGHPIEYAEVIILTFKNGKIVDHKAVADTVGLMQAIAA